MAANNLFHFSYATCGEDTEKTRCSSKKYLFHQFMMFSESTNYGVSSPPSPYKLNFLSACWEQIGWVISNFQRTQWSNRANQLTYWSCDAFCLFLNQLKTTENDFLLSWSCPLFQYDLFTGVSQWSNDRQTASLMVHPIA